MDAVCVYCGSSDGADPAFAVITERLGDALVAAGLTLVYGGARNGLMGRLADRVLAQNGDVIGVIPHALVAWEQAHPGLTELHQVDTMHARKQGMMARADGFIALPGGIGTLEEIFEMISWAQLGVHAKPCGFISVGGYYDALIEFLDHSVAQGLMRRQTREMILIESDPEVLLARMARYRSPVTHRWIDSAQT
ncbi:TIGR00730 family Rossman fold protein [Motiliproteus sp. SC1-56]|uniref:LOG family protein n=1 Tax=Motiliproteus sp. SC1-56 TaxID=2799565 RepID=UPI001A90A7AC|nr:TIGR00730 family Rossman fold protein [Motiliproteus sp. SC1-56]